MASVVRSASVVRALGLVGRPEDVGRPAAVDLLAGPGVVASDVQWTSVWKHHTENIENIQNKAYLEQCDHGMA